MLLIEKIYEDGREIGYIEEHKEIVFLFLFEKDKETLDRTRKSIEEKKNKPVAYWIEEDEDKKG